MLGREESHSILWGRLDQPGHEHVRLTSRDSFWPLSGTAVFAHEAQPCRLDYLVVCNKGWETVSAEVTGWVGDRTIGIAVSADSSRRWQINGAACPEEEGCIDLDLNFSPSTNLLTIRRLDLAVGQEAEVRAAWLRLPGFRLEPLPTALPENRWSALPLSERWRKVCHRPRGERRRFCHELSRRLEPGIEAVTPLSQGQLITQILHVAGLLHVAHVAGLTPICCETRGGSQATA